MSKEPREFMEKYGVESDEVWEVRRGGAWAVKHAALERIAVQQGIKFDPPQIIEASGSDKCVAICVTGNMDDKWEWSIGEAAPSNNKNAYPFAMAEKRAKDRVILKLLQVHGAVYSEDEAEDLAPTKNGRPAQLAKKDAREVYTKLQTEIRDCKSREQLRAWGDANKDRIAVLPDDWQDTLRIQYEEHSLDLKQREAA